jgi:hypothetical protein
MRTLSRVVIVSVCLVSSGTAFAQLGGNQFGGQALAGFAGAGNSLPSGGSYSPADPFSAAMAIYMQSSQRQQSGSSSQQNRDKASEEFKKAVYFWGKRSLHDHCLENERAMHRSYLAEVKESNVQYQAWSKEHLGSTRLSAAELEPTSGAIAWPVILRSAPFAADRTALDAFYKVRAERREAGSYTEVRRLTRSMQDELARRLVEIEPADFIVAHKFLNALSNEARFPPAVRVAVAPAADGFKLAQVNGGK